MPNINAGHTSSCQSEGEIGRQTDKDKPQKVTRKSYIIWPANGWLTFCLVVEKGFLFLGGFQKNTFFVHFQTFFSRFQVWNHWKSFKMNKTGWKRQKMCWNTQQGNINWKVAKKNRQYYTKIKKRIEFVSKLISFGLSQEYPKL